MVWKHHDNGRYERVPSDEPAPVPTFDQEISQLIAQYQLGLLTPIEFACRIAFVQLPNDAHP